MTPDVQGPIITRYGYTWVQHPDGLYYGPSYPGEDATLAWMEGEGANMATASFTSVRTEADRVGAAGVQHQAR